MHTRRVVITGTGAVSPLGIGVEALVRGLTEGRSSTRFMEKWGEYRGLRSMVAAPSELRDEQKIPRQKRRTMSRMSIFAAQSADEALRSAGIAASAFAPGRLGCVIGSTTGSSISLNACFEEMLPHKDISTMTAARFFQSIAHTASINVANYLELTGAVLATCAACASGLQAVGAAYDLIRLGKQDAVLAGGAEELHPTATGSFDVLLAASTKYNGAPSKTPRPFDRDRDGLVCGEGSGILLLEDAEHAAARRATPLAEIIGYHTCSSGSHVSQSDRAALVRCFREALADARVSPGQIDYINAHAAGTVQGDAAEAQALAEVFGDRPPISSLKGNLSHTLGASGAIELIASIEMMRLGKVFPTLNLENIDPACGGVRHAQSPVATDIRTLVKNSFAFGGINSVIVCKKPEL